MLKNWHADLRRLRMASLKDKISLRRLRQRKHRKPDLYSNVEPKECIIVGEDVT